LLQRPPASRHEGAALLCYREGKVDAALAWLRPAMTNPYTDTAGAPLAAAITALLQQAVQTQHFDEAKTQLLKLRGLASEQGELDYSSAHALPLLQIAALEQIAGHRRRAEQIAQRVLAIDQTPSSEGRYGGVTGYVRLLALALLGRDEEAVAMLQAHQQAFAHQLWWVWLERHPALERLRHDPRVQRMLTELRSWEHQQRLLIDTQRRAGALPMRSAPAMPDPCSPALVAQLH
jgi:hypothetical protein